MSQTDQTPQLPPVEKAAELLDRIYVDAFFSKMAEYGHFPNSEQDAIGMLETAVALDAVDPAPQEKVSNDKYAQANQNLQAYLGQQGILPDPEVDSIKQAAYALAHDADVYRSVLSVLAAQAEYQAAQE